MPQCCYDLPTILISRCGNRINETYCIPAVSHTHLTHQTQCPQCSQFSAFLAKALFADTACTRFCGTHLEFVEVNVFFTCFSSINVVVYTVCSYCKC